MTEWETIDVPAGAFIGWGNTPGQAVTGKVLTFDPAGAQDYNGNVCPELGLELVEPAASYNKAGERFDYATGDLVNLTCGATNLKRAVMAASPSAGDLVKITLQEIKPLNGGRSVKIFDLKIARGAGGASTPATPTPQAPAAQPAANTPPTPPAPAAGEPVKPDSFPQEVWDTLEPAAKTAVLAQQ
ncbi:hypothetical protein MYK68_14090 [Gordonia sp. PP30]|uniref:hypothetical protein n=1 Tax=Gordonia sp. PP30 TaxID=2935861 RepID=UPI001FFE3C32|nr:hypothetical protein [Gordonia sp. PP30]UQE73861.1 hypothetical protein MYK68_14090 [Gordonia sp. PP30]